MQRSSIRGFLRDRVPSETDVRELLSLALRAPSGGNTQVRYVTVYSGGCMSACRTVVALEPIASHVGGGESTALPVAGCVDSVKMCLVAQRIR
jgi:nitroreductase